MCSHEFWMRQAFQKLWIELNSNSRLLRGLGGRVKFVEIPEVISNNLREKRGVIEGDNAKNSRRVMVKSDGNPGGSTPKK